MNKNYIPIPQDENLRMESVITKTASFVGTALDLGNGFKGGGVGKAAAAVVNISAGDFTTGDESYAFTLEESADNSTWTAAGPAVSPDTATPNLVAKAISVPGFVSQRYVRVHAVFCGTTPSVTYEAWFNPNLVL